MSHSAFDKVSTSNPVQYRSSDDLDNARGASTNVMYNAGDESQSSGSLAGLDDVSTNVPSPSRSDSLPEPSASSLEPETAGHVSQPAETPRRPVYKKKMGSKPRGILKPAPPPQKAFSFRRDILQNLNTRLAQQGVNVQVPVPQGGTAQATASYIGGMFRRIGGIAAGAAANVSGSTGPSVGGLVPNESSSRSDNASTSSLDSELTLGASRSSLTSQSSDTTLVPVKSNSDSTTSATPLKKVQFRVSHMTVTYPIVGAGAPEDEDLTRLRIEREHRRTIKARRGKPWTPQELETLYRECCRTREEHPLKKMRLVFQEADQAAPPALKTMDLSFVPLDRHAVEPIADLLSVDFGLNKLVLENCALTDSSVKSILHALLVSGSLPNLSIASNRKIRYHGWRYVAIFMRRARALRYLDLSENSINRASLEHILEAISKPEKIQGGATEQSAKAGVPDGPERADAAEEDEDDEFFDNSAEPLMPTAPLLRQISDETEALTSAVISLRLENCGLKTSTLEMLSHAVRFSDIRHLSLRRNRINQLASVALAIMLKDYPDRVSTSTATINGEDQSHFGQATAYSSTAPSVEASETLDRPGRSVLPKNPNTTLDHRQRSYSPSLPEVPVIVSSPGGGFTSRKMPAANGYFSQPGTAYGANADHIQEAMTHQIGSPTRELDARITAEERLDIRKNAAPNLSEEEAIAIYQAKRAKRILADLPRVGNLLTLDLKSNDIRGGIVYLAQVLKKNRTLRVLNLSDNSIEIPGLVAIAEALKYNSTLETLDLSHNPCSGPGLEGVTTLRTAFALNSNLKRLFLNDTNLSSEAAIALAEFLPEARSLIHLDLAENYDIDIAGVMALAVSLRMNHSLRCLDLNIPANNPDFARLSQEILQSCVRNTELAQKRATQKGLKQPIPALIYKSVVARAARENDERLKAIQTAQNAALSAAGKDTQAVEELIGAATECHRVLTDLFNSEKERRRSAPEQRVTPKGEFEQDLIEQSESLRKRLGELASTVESEALLERMLRIHDDLGDITTRIVSFYQQDVAQTKHDSSKDMSLPIPAQDSDVYSSSFSVTNGDDSDDSDGARRDEQRRSRPSSIGATISQAVEGLRIDTAAADREESDPEDSDAAKGKLVPRSPSEDRANRQLSEEGELFRKAKSLGLDEDDTGSDNSHDQTALNTARNGVEVEGAAMTSTHASSNREDALNGGKSHHRQGSAGSASLSPSGTHGNFNAELSGEELRKDLLEASVPPKPAHAGSRASSDSSSNEA